MLLDSACSRLSRRVRFRRQELQKKQRRQRTGVLHQRHVYRYHRPALHPSVLYIMRRQLHLAHTRLQRH